MTLRRVLLVVLHAVLPWPVQNFVVACYKLQAKVLPFQGKKPCFLFCGRYKASLNSKVLGIVLVALLSFA